VNGVSDIKPVWGQLPLRGRDDWWCDDVITRTYLAGILQATIITKVASGVTPACRKACIPFLMLDLNQNWNVKANCNYTPWCPVLWTSSQVSEICIWRQTVRQDGEVNRRILCNFLLLNAIETGIYCHLMYAVYIVTINRYTWALVLNIQLILELWYFVRLPITLCSDNS
jgi:hypothetical protein